MPGGWKLGFPCSENKHNSNKALAFIELIVKYHLFPVPSSSSGRVVPDLCLWDEETKASRGFSPPPPTFRAQTRSSEMARGSFRSALTSFS